MYPDEYVWERDREWKWLHDGDVLGKGGIERGWELDPRLSGHEMIMMVRGQNVSCFNSLLWFIWIIESTTEPNS